MSTVIPAPVAQFPLTAQLLEAGLELMHQGKVRDTFALPGDESKLLVVATDRISVFDCVLPVLVPEKGSVLTATTVFWFQEVFKDISHHLVSYGTAINKSLPPFLHNNSELQRRALIVHKLNMIPVECIARGWLTGSAWRDYQNSPQHLVCGTFLPRDLHDGAHLTIPVFTPTTKAQQGHDTNLDPRLVKEQYGAGLRELTLRYYNRAVEYAAKRDLLLVDTKLEFGKKAGSEILFLADEVFTPDSSRYWDRNEWEEARAQKKAPRALDKEVMRQWALSLDPPLNTLDPTNPEDLEKVAQLKVPPDIVSEVSKRYQMLFHRLTKHPLRDFQRIVMKIAPRL